MKLPTYKKLSIVWWYVIFSAMILDMVIMFHPNLDRKLIPHMAFFGIVKCGWLYFSFDRIFKPTKP